MDVKEGNLGLVEMAELLASGIDTLEGPDGSWDDEDW
jgi:hypothetical protein